MMLADPWVTQASTLSFTTPDVIFHRILECGYLWEPEKGLEYGGAFSCLYHVLSL